MAIGFHVAKTVEKVSVRLGIGKFEVGENWKCRECQHDDEDLCADCRASWLDEVKHLEYSNAYERRLNNRAGIAGLLMGFTALLGNASMGLWETGGFVGGITEAFKARLPFLILVSPTWKSCYDYLLIFLFFVSQITIFSAFFVACYLMAVNPTSKRHWRHMTPSMYAVLLVQTVAYIVVIGMGVSIPEIVFVLGPIMMGSGGLMASMCMRKTEEVEEVLGKLDAEERM